MVELGDDDGARHADRGALLPQRDRGGVDPVDRGDDEQGGVGGAQAGPQLADEVRVAGGVEQGDLVPVVLDGATARDDRALLRTSAGSVSQTVVPSSPSRPADRAGGDEQGLDQGGLPRAGVAHEGHVADLARVRRPPAPRRPPHGPLSSWSLSTPLAASASSVLVTASCDSTPSACVSDKTSDRLCQGHTRRAGAYGGVPVERRRVSWHR